MEACSSVQICKYFINGQLMSILTFEHSQLLQNKQMACRLAVCKHVHDALVRAC